MNPISLPIDSWLPEIQRALSQVPSIVIKAEPGAGKTTRVPPALLKNIQGKIFVVEPRRLAAKYTAMRVAEETGWKLGARIGYQVRFDYKINRDTQLIYGTDGIFMNILRNNPRLEGVEVVIIDEFHERRLNTDLILALVKRLQQNERPDLKLVVMSATFDSKRIQEYLPSAKRFEVEGRTFPVAIKYLNFSMDQRPEQLVRAALGVYFENELHGKNILVFLEGTKSILNAKELCQNLAKSNGYEVCSLSSRTSYSEQNRIFSMDGLPKLILSTNIAETSLTIPNVGGVIDVGIEKRSGFDFKSGVNSLRTVKVSQASMAQRAGRAGRVQSGVCYRMGSEADYLRRASYTPAEIFRTNLEEMVLLLSELGVKNPEEEIPWFEVPDESSLSIAWRTLKLLGLISREGKITSEGIEVLRIPLGVRQANLFRIACELGFPRSGAEIAVILDEGWGGYGNSQQNTCGDDLERRRRAFRHLLKKSDKGEEIVLKQYHLLLDKRGGAHEKAEASHEELCFILLSSFPDRVAGKTVGSDYQLFFEGKAKISKSSDMHRPDYLLFLEADYFAEGEERGTTLLHQGMPLSRSDIEVDPLSLISNQTKAVWDHKVNMARSSFRRMYGAILLEEKSVKKASIASTELLTKNLKEKWPAHFDMDPFSRLMGRLDFARRYGDLSQLPNMVSFTRDHMIESLCEGKSSFAEVDEDSFQNWLYEHFNYEQLEVLDEIAPIMFVMPGGAKLRIQYKEDEDPFALVRMQDCYGLKESPSLAGGGYALKLHLLAPNKRVLQITQDIAAFWSGAYREVRGEMKKRYPKHVWPENPAEAKPLPPGKIRYQK